MDEPFSGLDVQLRENMQEETLALLRETRASSMIVTHHPEEAMRLADRIAVMRKGRVVQAGTAEELYQRPAELFVARLFSEINEISCRVDKGSVVMPFGRIPADGFADGAAAILCIRERGIRLQSSRPGLSGRVLHVRFLGDVQLIEIGVAGFEAPLRARTSEADRLVKGAEVSIEIDPREVLLFPEIGAEIDRS
jgi:iron(III) transport system ATP-binding protein